MPEKNKGTRMLLDKWLLATCQCFSNYVFKVPFTFKGLATSHNLLCFGMLAWWSS